MQEKSELEKLRAMAAVAGVDVNRLLEEVQEATLDKILPHLRTMQEQTIARINEIKEALPSQIADKAKETASGIVVEGQKQVNAMLNEIREGLPALITDKANEAVNTLVESFAKRTGVSGVKAENPEAGADGKVRGGGLDRILGALTPETILEIIRLWKSPSDQTALMNQMRFGMQWMALGQRLAKGGAQGSDVVRAIDETFGRTSGQ